MVRGWLKALAKERGYRSLRALALATQRAAAWPARDQRDKETVANKLRDADKLEDLGWWLGTGRALVPALAEALHEHEDDALEWFHAGSGDAASDHGLIPFRMFPGLRPLDLDEEGLFPGIPEEITQTGGPRVTKLWWLAPPGAGKTVVGHRLKRRFGWNFVQADRWADVQLPSEGRVFVELSSSDGLSYPALATIPSALRVTIAAPFLPPPHEAARKREQPLGKTEPEQIAESSDDAFTVVHVPPTSAWLDRLLAWIAARVRADGGFDAARMRSLITQHDLGRLFKTPGTLLEFAGLVDNVGIKAVFGEGGRDTNSKRFVAVWLKAALDRPDRHTPAGVAARLKKKGASLLIEMEAQRLRRALPQSLPVADWWSLLPQDQAPEIDRDALLEVLSSGDVDAATKAKAMLAPDPGAIVDGLRTIGALQGDSDRLALAPAWLGAFVHDAAVRQLLNEIPAGLGALLLFEATATDAMERLIEQVVDEKTATIELILENLDPRSPESMAALDGAFRAVGFALAGGAQIPAALVARVWEAQKAHVHNRWSNMPPVPRLGVFSTDHWRGPTSIRGWFAADLAISHALATAITPAPTSAPNVWHELPRGTEDRAAWAESIAHAGDVFDADEQPFPRIRSGLFRLGSELLSRHGIVRWHQGIIDVQGPALLVALASGERFDLKEQELHALLQLPSGLDALREQCERRKIELNVVLAWCWTEWNKGGERWPPEAWRDNADIDRHDLEQLWRAAPATAISAELCRRIASWPDVWLFLSDEVWARWLDAWAAQHQRWVDGAKAFQVLPASLALRAVRDGHVDAWSHEVRAILWRRMPEELIGLIEELATQQQKGKPRFAIDGGPVSYLVASTPGAHTPAVLRQAERWARTPAEFPGIGEWLRIWLSQVVEQRLPGWRDAYSRLIENC